MHIAVGRTHLAVVSMLLARGAEIEATTEVSRRMEIDLAKRMM